MRARKILVIALAGAAFASCKSEKKEAAKEGAEPESPGAPTQAAIDASAAKKETGEAIGDTPPGHAPGALAEVKAASGSDVKGTVAFKTLSPTKVEVKLSIEGLTPGEHGFHIHEVGDCSADDASSAGGHFNPTKAEHGSPEGEAHHAGDFGNITADESGKAEASWEADWISLKEGAENNVLNRAVVVHAEPDDLKSQPSGAAGPRIGCGVIKAQ